MKKLYYLIVLTVILGLVLTGCTLLSNIGQVPTNEQSGISYLTKHTADDPDTTPLMAGQYEEVGTVSVWNDGVKLYVKYDITEEGWCLTETHVHVGEDPEDFPLAGKQGNPVPGKFDHSDPHGCVLEYTYEISLGDWGVDKMLYIAAHAVVKEVTCFDGTSGLTIEGTENLDIDGSITVEALVKVEASVDGKFYTIVGKWKDGDDDDRAWLLGLYFDLYPCFYISNDGEVYPKAISGEKLNIGQWYHLKGTFDSVTGEIKIYVDSILKNTNDTDLVNIYLNEEPVFIGGDRAGGVNGRFFNGCIDEVNVWDGIGEGATLVLEWPEIETAWGAGMTFVKRGNWATYFTYTVQLPQDSMVLWLDAGKGITEIGGLVSNWEDQSVNGNNAVQGTASFQPTHITDELNDKPIVRFTGGEKYLRHSSILFGDYTAFYVLKLTESKKIRFIFTMQEALIQEEI